MKSTITDVINLKIDFRFADDEDIEDIYLLVNDSNKVEQDESNSQCFRKTGSLRKSKKEIEEDFICISSNIRWIVLETPTPEEAMIACARLLLQKADDTVKIDTFGAIGGESISNSSPSDYVYSALLGRVETIVRSLGFQKIIIEIPEWRVDLQDIVIKREYVDNAGYSWPESSSEILIRPTMIIVFQKIFPSLPKNTSLLTPSVALPSYQWNENNVHNFISNQLISHNNDDDDSNYIEVHTTSDIINNDKMVDLSINGMESLDLSSSSDNIFSFLSNASFESANQINEGNMGDTMEGLIDNLFSALHKEYN